MLALALLLTAGASKEIGPTANLHQEVAALMPGDELILQGGLYGPPGGSGFWNITVSGTPALPIVIRSKTGERAHYRLATTAQNIVNVTGSYLVFRDLEFSGGSRGLRFQAGAGFITVEGCEVHDTVDVAIAANDSSTTYDGFRFIANHVHHTGTGTGEGFYLGCNNAACRFVNGVIERNWVHDTLASSQGDGIEVKEGSYNNVIRDNVIHDTNYPCITLYSASPFGAQPNLVERNVMWHCGDHGVQVSRDATLRNNIVLSAVNEGLSVRTHAQVDAGAGNVTVVNNTVLDTGAAGIAIRGAISPVLVANNAIYVNAGSAIFMNTSGTNVSFRGNAGVGTAAPTLLPGNLANDFVAANFLGRVPNDVFPKAGGALVDAGDPSVAPADDFNGTARGVPTTVGAYQFAASNPGWAVDAGFKRIGGSGGGSGTGGGAAGGSAGGGAAGGSAGGGAAGGSAGGGAAGGSAGGAAGAGGGATAGGSGGSGGGGTAGGSGGSGGGSAGGAAGGTGGGAEMPGGCGCASGESLLAGLALALLRRRRTPYASPLALACSPGPSKETS